MVNKRIKRHKRIRKHVSGNESRPRVAVYRSNKYVQVQLIDDEKRVTLLGMTSKGVKPSKDATKTDVAKALGIEFGKKVLELEKGKYSKVVFDRGGYRYHGRVKAVAEGLRESGLVL